MLASVLTEITPREDFLGHIGGDDFAIIHFGDRGEDLCLRIIATFDARVRELYDAVDLQRGYLLGVDRHGFTRQFGLLSLSIALVRKSEQRFHSVDEMSRVAAELKQVAKSISGSSYAMDRRHMSQQPGQERRGRRRPAALLIAPSEHLHTPITTVLRQQGYKPLIARSVIRAQGLLDYAPEPSLLIAEMAEEAIWEIWQQLPPPTLLIAIVTEQQSVEAALSRGATAALVVGEDLTHFGSELLAQVPVAGGADPV